MGHNHIDPLPRSKQWTEVVRLVSAGAEAPQVATATLEAAGNALLPVAGDAAVVEAVWVLARLPMAAQEDDFAAALRRVGLDVSDSPGLTELAAAAAERVDIAGTARPSDLGEMAQAALFETLYTQVGGRIENLFGTDPADVRRAFAETATVKQFGHLAVDFFARLTGKCLGFFVSRFLANEVGDGKRFQTLDQQAAFADALSAHARLVAGGVETFAGKWFSKQNWETDGSVSRDQAGGFLAHAAEKLVAGLGLGEPVRA